jgi:hypothetical protein
MATRSIFCILFLDCFSKPEFTGELPQQQDSAMTVLPHSMIE